MTQQNEPVAGTISRIKPVLIVGAGPTGLTAALELSRFGIPVRIIDKLPAPSATSRALAIQARTLELLEQRGLTAEMLLIGNRAIAASLYGSGKRLGKIQLTQIPSRYNYILLLSQAETERILRGKLESLGILVERSTELIAFSQAESSAQSGVQAGVKAILRHSDGALGELDAAFMISAEGAHSTIRRTLNLAFKGKSLKQNYVLADLYLDGDIPENELSIFLADDGLLAVFPMGNRRFRMIATDPEQRVSEDSEPTLEELQRVYDADAFLPARLRDMVWSSRFRINSRMLHTLRERYIFFGGDSAHIHSPAGGQGMNTGIQDMIDLGWKLALVLQGKASPELLNTYEEERLPVIRQVVARTETATDVANSESPLVHQLITHIAPLLLNQPFIQQMGTGLISEITANYRGSALSQTHRTGGDLRAGDRVPDLDVLVVQADSQPREASLHTLLDPTGLTLLVAGGEPNPFPPVWQESLKPWQSLLTTQYIRSAEPETNNAFSRSFGSGQSFLLVRPDSYLGFVSGENQLPALIDWLKRWFPPTVG